MTTFLALYRGKTISDAKLINVSLDPVLVNFAVSQMISELTPEDESSNKDRVLKELKTGRRKILELIAQEGDE